MEQKRILVVDDEPVVLQTISLLLEEEGYDVTGASSGEEALDIFRQQPFPLVICDIVMPGISGLEVLAEVKRHDIEAHVIIITSQYSVESAIAALRQGAYDYLCKPFEDLELILSAVKRTFDNIHLHYENKKLIEQYIEKNDELRIVNAKLKKDIYFREKAEERVKQLAYYDDLTGLANRLLFKDRLSQAIAHAERAGNPVALLFLDLDGFKHVNDTLGHGAGDMLLVSVAQRLEANVRRSDTVARLGGDEFVIVLTSNKNESEIELFAKKVLRMLAQPFNIDGKKVFTSSSIGIVLFPNDCRDYETMLKYADMAMYDAKAAGKNTYRLYSEELNGIAVERLGVEHNLRHALDRDEFHLVYQPQVDIISDKIIGAEALLRWDHPEEGLIPPQTFIPIAEAIGVINQLGEWVMNEACRQNMAWIKAGLPALKMAVNVSAHQFKQPGLLKVVDLALAQSGLAAKFLEIELTESTLVEDTEATAATLQGLHERGVSISIDDFGTGYSSLNYLKHFHIDRIKIDQSFVRGLPADKDDCAITGAIIAMGFNLGHKVVAEGVETRQQLDYLQKLQCREVQGFLFAKPMGAEEFSDFVNAKTGGDELLIGNDG